MSRLDDLPPDQRAVLSLLLRSRKSYADVASMLEIPEQAVRDRAHAALAVLAPAQARLLDAEQREEVGDYMLGQLSTPKRLLMRTRLESSSESRAWASALSEALTPLAAESLPPVPEGRAPLSAPVGDPARGDHPSRGASGWRPAPGSGEKRSMQAPPISRTGGALVLLAIAALAVIVVFVTKSGDGSSSGTSSSVATSASTSAETGTSSTAGTQTAKAKEDKRITLTSPDPTSKAAGVAEVLSEGSQYAFYLAAEHLAPSKGNGFFYAVWLYNSPSSFEALSRAPAVGSNGDTQGGALLPSDASKYHTMLLTRETSSKPTRPGTIVLRGSFALH
jgi:hypothetical protein